MPMPQKTGWEAEFIALLRAGYGKTEAAGRVGITMQTINRYSQRSAALADAVRAATSAAGPDGIHADEDFDDTCCRQACDRLGIWYAGGRAYCQTHWSVYRSNDRRTTYLRGRGMCGCGKQAHGRAQCQSCVDVQNKRVHGHREKGLCITCGKQKEREDIQRCEACTESMRATKRRHSRRKRSAAHVNESPGAAARNTTYGKD